MKKEEQQEPTNKELLQIMFEIADLAITIFNEHRQFLQNLKEMPKTQEEMEFRALEMAETVRETNRHCDIVQNALTKYAHLIDLGE